MTELSNGELGRMIAALQTQVREGFENMGDRVTGVSRQVRTLERTVDVQGQKVTNLEREIFRQPAVRVLATAGAPGAGADEGSRSLTRRELQIVVATLGTAATVITGVLGLLKLFGRL